MKCVAVVTEGGKQIVRCFIWSAIGIPMAFLVCLSLWDEERTKKKGGWR